MIYLLRGQRPCPATPLVSCPSPTLATNYSRIAPQCRRRPHIDETTRLLPKLVDQCPQITDLTTTLYILGTRISLSCAMKSSMIFFGLSLMSTSLQYTQLCSFPSAALSR